MILLGILLLLAAIVILYYHINTFRVEGITNLSDEHNAPPEFVNAAIMASIAQYKFQQKIAWLLFIVCMIYLMGSSIYLYTNWLGSINEQTTIPKAILILTEGGLCVLAFQLIKYADAQYNKALDRLKKG